MRHDPNDVIRVALGEVGYLEKASNKDLDDKTANPGSANWNRYARDLARYPFYNGRKSGVAWCDIFVDWCFVTAYGKDAALEMTNQPTTPKRNLGAGCRYSRGYYQEMGRLYDAPEAGDQVFFYGSDGSAIAHTGLVVKVSGSAVYTVEGNTSENGRSGVFQKKYDLGDKRFAGFGRPAWGEKPQPPQPEDTIPPPEDAADPLDTPAMTPEEAATVPLMLPLDVAQRLYAALSEALHGAGEEVTGDA